MCRRPAKPHQPTDELRRAARGPAGIALLELPRAAGHLAVLVAAAESGLGLGFASFAGLLVEALAAHVLVEPRPDHAAPELLERPVQAIVLTELNLDQTRLQAGKPVREEKT